ncbi:peptidylprolyl isomerase [Dictyobacter arantiisoli]|uniref:peptidylprolyl isomerase n=1 Tax=Dictyobacter arantiisoli TaxID=2014874 RepID=A0A5A5TEX3_9CHLR|nr:peptidylprolyl isomerase [Dictyobacter arantiisoli]GCF09877.1 hypothetical protein KDI_34410 [Dictyobacter arantiisoli]
MPKTTKRAEARRAAKISRAHSTQLPNLDVKSDQGRRTPPGYKPPARGIARYPWAASILVAVVIICAGLYLFTNHLWPFALAKATTTKPAVTATSVVKSATTPQVAATPTTAVISGTVTDAASPCAKNDMLSAVTDTSAGPTANQVKSISHTYSKAENVIDTNKIYCAGINTNHGLVVVELDPKLAPNTVNNFVFLAQKHFYDGLTFHRVMSGFMAQGGDPTGTGTGGPGYKFNDEKVQGSYTAGTIAMANSGANTNGSQFFINTVDNSSKLTKSYNLFGHVVQGLNVVQSFTINYDASNNPIAGAAPNVMEHVIVKAAS